MNGYACEDTPLCETLSALPVEANPSQRVGVEYGPPQHLLPYGKPERGTRGCVCGVLAQLLSDCHALYCEQRLALLASVVQDRLLQYGADQTIAAMTRSGCSYLIQVCEQERELFQHFFPGEAGDAALAPLLDPLCTVLYDLLRPAVVELTGIEPLCDLADILQVWARPPSLCAAAKHTALEQGSHTHPHRAPTTQHIHTRIVHHRIYVQTSATRAHLVCTNPTGTV